jgi:hypothetical protein
MENGPEFPSTQRGVFVEGWETGYKARNEEVAAWLEHMSDEVGDGEQRELFYDLAQEVREGRDGREPRWPDPATIASI